MGENVPEAVVKAPHKASRTGRAVALFAVCLIVLSALLELGLRVRTTF